MTILLLDSLDVYDDAADLAADGRWVIQNGAPTFQPTAGKGGGGCVKCQSDSDRWKAVFGPYAFDRVGYISFDIFFDALPSGNHRFFDVRSEADNPHFGLSLDSSGNLRPGDADNFNGDASSLLPTTPLVINTWQRVEMKYNVGFGSINGNLDTYIDGVLYDSRTNRDFFWSTDRPNYLRFMSTESGINYYYDNIVVMDDAGQLLGASAAIHVVRGTADEATQNWTKSSGSDGYALVDDALGSSDGDATYVESTGPGDVSEFTLGNLSIGSDSILGAQVRSKAKKNGAGAAAYRATLKSGGTLVAVPTLAPDTGYKWGRELMEADPTGVQFTETSFNAATLVIKAL